MKRGREEEGENVKDHCHQDCGPVFDSVATYHSIVFLLQARQFASMVLVVGEGGG